jgi:hypothetical protein
MLIGGGILAVAAVVAAPRLIRAARPVLREGLKRGLNIYERARGAAAEALEDVEDLVAEVRAEMKGQTKDAAPTRAEHNEPA